MGLQTKQEILVYMLKGFWSRDLALLDHIPRIGLVEWDWASSAYSETDGDIAERGRGGKQDPNTRFAFAVIKKNAEV